MLKRVMKKRHIKNRKSLKISKGIQKMVKHKKFKKMDLDHVNSTIRVQRKH